MAKLFAVDLDGTLTIGPCWTKEQCLTAPAREDIIYLINELYKQGHIILIWTARREYLRIETEYWLKKHCVLYHAIDMGHKPGCDAYIDDRAINSLDYFNVVKGLERTKSLSDKVPEVNKDE